MFQKMDKLSSQQRRKNMQAVKSKGTKIEVKLGKALWNMGLRYRKNDKSIFGKPDFTFKKYKIAIFCDGDFWHGKDWEIRKFDHKTNIDFWISKIDKNIQRDQLVNETLNAQHWTILRFWESDINKDLESCIELILEIMEYKKQNIKTFSLEKFIHDKKYKISFFGKHALNQDGTLLPFNEQMAIITHYLQNSGTQYENEVKNKAIGLIEDINQFHNNTNSHIAENPLQYNLFSEINNIPFPASDNPKFSFIDLFAGIGGFRMALQNLGGKCVFSAEWDEQAQKTYFINYGEVPFGDITLESTKNYIPDNFDILCAGFPCQAFSLAGKRLGFEETRGTLFFDVAEIIRRKKPKAFFLENVKGLKIHDKGQTLKTILKVLREDLGYYVPDPEIINAKNFGVPQNRERIYIVGFRKDLNINKFKYPEQTDNTKKFCDIKEKECVSSKYYLSTQYLKTLVLHKERHANKGNGFGYEIINDDEIANAIVVGGMGRERNLVFDDRLCDFTPKTNIKGEINREGIRKMTPREWARLQGFPDNFKIEVADASAYKQFGNSVAVPAIQATAKEILTCLNLISNEK